MLKTKRVFENGHIIICCKQHFCLIINAKFVVLIKLDWNFIRVSVEFMEPFRRIVSALVILFWLFHIGQEIK